MNRKLFVAGSALTILALNQGALLPGPASTERAGGMLASHPNTALAQGRPAQAAAFELWVLDQSDTRTEAGGTLYIYQGNDLSSKDPARAKPEVIDLGGEVSELALARTGSLPRRPHMMAFNPSFTHGIISFVLSGHVLFIEAATRKPVAIFDVGAQAHAAFASPDEKYVLVANQNGKLLQRIRTDYQTNTFVLEEAATLDLKNGATPSGAPREEATLRPDNAPIWPLIDPTSRFSFVTLRGGGLFVVNNLTSPMQIVGEYDQSVVHAHGVVGALAGDKIYFNSGGGTVAHPHGSKLYTLPLNAFSSTPNPPNTPAPKLVFSHEERGAVDAHGAVLVGGGKYLWIADRTSNRLIVVDVQHDHVVNEIHLTGSVSRDPAPDLMARSPDGTLVFVSLRGPRPLTGNAAGFDNAVGATPGVGIIRVLNEGMNGVLEAIAPINHVVDEVEHGDPHGISLRVK